jgi:DNA-binding response OmpR family regulator
MINSKDRSKILIVDDEKEMVGYLSEYFVSRGYRVYAAVDGSEALRKVETLNPDVVLLDLLMPGIHGMEVLTRIKSSHPRTAVVIMTALINETVAEEALEAGADAYIAKPFNLEKIETLIRSVIDRYR